MARVGFGGKKLCTMKLFKDPTLLLVLPSPITSKFSTGLPTFSQQMMEERRHVANSVEGLVVQAWRWALWPHSAGQNSVFDFKLEGLKSFIMINK